MQWQQYIVIYVMWIAKHILRSILMQYSSMSSKQYNAKCLAEIYQLLKLTWLYNTA